MAYLQSTASLHDRSSWVIRHFQRNMFGSRTFISVSLGAAPPPRSQNDSWLDNEAGGNVSWWLYRHDDLYGRNVPYLTLLITECRNGWRVYRQQARSRVPISDVGTTAAAGCLPEDCCTLIKSCQFRVCFSLTSVFYVSADSQDVKVSLSEL